MQYCLKRLSAKSGSPTLQVACIQGSDTMLNTQASLSFSMEDPMQCILWRHTSGSGCRLSSGISIQAGEEAVHVGLLHDFLLLFGP